MSRKKILIYSIAAIFLFAAGFFIWKLDLPSWQKLDLEKIRSVPLATTVLDENGISVGELYPAQNRVYTPISELPEYIPQAFIAAEDARFYSHWGIDLRRIMGALWHDVMTGSLAQGASTITQQLIKLTHLSSEKTLARKAQEAWLAIVLERKMSKTEILDAYLNTVYFGSGAYGIGAAAEVFFGKDARELTLGESALLAGMIKSPSGYSPGEHPDKAKDRRKYVLDAMADSGFIELEMAKSASMEQIFLVEDVNVSADTGWYLDEVAKEAQEILGLDADGLFSGGYIIHTGMNVDMQKQALKILENGSVYPDTSAQGALIATDPVTGEIHAVVGGRKYEVQRGLNRAIDARRQTGSVIKPISTYAAAVDRHGYVPTTCVYDVPREYPGGYFPGNSGGEFSGTVTLRTALSRSLNAATVDLADTIGMNVVCRYAKNFGITLDKSDENLAFALGSMARGATPAEICAAYCALANGGHSVHPHTIRRIEDRYGNVIYEYRHKSDSVVSPESAYIITDMLKTAVTSGTARNLSYLEFPVAAKTGTAGLENGDTSDAWTCAYTPDLVVTAWMGHDSNSDGGMAASVTGGGYAAPVCAEFLKAASPYLSGRDFPVPEGVIPMLVDKYLLESSLDVALVSQDTPGKYCVREIFTENTVPEKTSAIWQAPEPVEDFAVEKSAFGKPLISFVCLEELTEYMIVRETDGTGEVAVVLRGNPGEEIIWEDTQADISGAVYYTVIPRHSLLYESGQLLTAEYTTRIRYSDGILGSLTSIFDGSTGAERIESGEFPLF